MLISAIVS